MSWGKTSFGEKCLSQKYCEKKWGKMTFGEKRHREKCRGEKCHLGKNVLHPTIHNKRAPIALCIQLPLPSFLPICIIIPLIHVTKKYTERVESVSPLAS